MSDEVSTTHGKSTLQWDLLVGLLPLVAFAPLLIYQAAVLWSSDTTQFFPLTLLCLFGLIGLQWHSSQETLHPVRKITAIVLFAIGAAIYIFAVWQFSPWLAHLALVFTFAAWALGRFGGKHWAGVAAWSGLLLTTLPWPWGWDSAFINWMHSSAAWLTAKVLDALAIPCLQNGSLIEIRGMRIVADEVCGGLGSVFAFGSFAVLLGLVLHQSFVASFKNLLLVPLWAFLGSFLRLIGILLVYEYWGRDLSNGWDFRVVEVATSLLVLVFVWAGAQFFSKLYEPIPVADAEFGPVFSGLNKIFCWPQPDPFDELEPEDDYEKVHFRRAKEEREARKTVYPDFFWTDNLVAMWGVRITAAVCLLCAILPIRTLASQGLYGVNFGLPNISVADLEKLGNSETFPEKLSGDWRQTGFRAERRNARSRMGEYSLIWRYQSAADQFEASIDLPFLGDHDPAVERTRQGWKLERTRTEEKDGWAWNESVLENELGGKAYIYHSLFTSRGEPFSGEGINPASSDATRGDTSSDGKSSVSLDQGDGTGASAAGLDELNMDSGTSAAASEPKAAGNASSDRNNLQEVKQITAPVTYQFQLISEPGDELGQVERTQLREKFFELREIARRRTVEVVQAN